MAKVGLRNLFEMETRNSYTKVNCEIGVSVEGRELPSMAVLGAAIEKAIEQFQADVKESYKVVPTRPTVVQSPAAPAVPVAPVITNEPAVPVTPTVPFGQ